MASWTSVPFRFGEPRAGLKLVIAGRTPEEIAGSEAHEKADGEDQDRSGNLPEQAVELGNRYPDGEEQQKANNRSNIVDAKPPEISRCDVRGSHAGGRLIVLIRRVPGAPAAVIEQGIHLTRPKIGHGRRDGTRLRFHPS